MRMRAATVTDDAASQFDAVLKALPSDLRFVVRPSVELQANKLGVTPRAAKSRFDDFRPRNRLTIRGDAVSDGRELVILQLTQEVRNAFFEHGSGVGQNASDADTPIELRLIGVGPSTELPLLDKVAQITASELGVDLTESSYSSRRFDELKQDGRESPSEPSSEELVAIAALRDQATRQLAIAIKSAGGLLVGDLQKQLSRSSVGEAETVNRVLTEAGLITGETVVVCGKSSAQTARVPSREILEHLATQGLKCACGRAVDEERIEEAVTITQLGRDLLDKSRWMTLLLVHELEQLGIPLGRILIEQDIGGDEMDCIADISGDIVFFELKDKMFNLGNAYSFAAKIGIIQPTYPVVLTSEKVGHDAREHFERAGTRRGPSYVAEPRKVRYIEGLDSLTKALQDLVTEIYLEDARARFSEVLELSVMDPMSALSEIAERPPAELPSTPPSRPRRSTAKRSPGDVAAGAKKR